MSYALTTYGQECYRAAERILPDYSEGERMQLLWAATCFPFGRLEKVEEQLKIADEAITTKKSVCMRCGALYDSDEQITFEEVCTDCDLEVCREEVKE